MAVLRLSILGREERKIIHEAALEILSKVGVKIPIKEVRGELVEAGAAVEKDVVKIPPDLVEWAIRKAPERIELYGRDGEVVAVLGGEKTFFNPGSAATKILDYEEGRVRNARLIDLFKFAVIADNLRNIAFQSTALVPSDVPVMIRDRVRLYPILLVSEKPIVTGAFTEDGVLDMVRILDSVCEAVRKPVAIFDVCPSPPLKWSRITLRNLVDCAKLKIPAEIIPMPIIGATGPVTLAGSIVQHHAEALSGITIAQVVNEGAPVIYGGSPCLLDMRHGTPLIASPESALVSLAYVELARELDLPTHAYMGLADSKMVDYQAGMESMMGALLATAMRINVVSGPGMLGFENVQSVEKLVLDDEACGYALRLSRGFEAGEEELAVKVIEEIGVGGHYLGHRHTLKNYRRELYMPSLLDRTPIRGEDYMNACLLRKAHKYCEHLLKEHKCNVIDSGRLRKLKKIIKEICGNNAEQQLEELESKIVF